MTLSTLECCFECAATLIVVINEVDSGKKQAGKYESLSRLEFTTDGAALTSNFKRCHFVVYQSFFALRDPLTPNFI